MKREVRVLLLEDQIFVKLLPFDEFLLVDHQVSCCDSSFVISTKFIVKLELSLSRGRRRSLPNLVNICVFAVLCFLSAISLLCKCSTGLWCESCSWIYFRCAKYL